MKKLSLCLFILSIFVVPAFAGDYLGNFSSNPYDSNSISNPYGAGSPYNSNSVNNPYGKYGSP